MADRQRCHCGELPVTADGYCSKHKHMSNPAPRVRSCEEKLAECMQARHQLNEALLEAKSRVSHYYTLIMRLKAGTTTIEEIDEWMS